MEMSQRGRRIAISDIHGCGDTFEALIRNKLQFNKEDTLYLLGDFIDRGPKSKKVIDLILDYQKQGYNVHCLMGNHEDMFLRSQYNHEANEVWTYMNGGIDTLNSFEISEVKEIPGIYQSFFENLGYYIILEDLILVHAGFNFNAQDPFEDYEAMMWIRGYTVDMEKTGGRTIIHGHTPILFEKIKKAVENKEAHIDIDNGCAYPMEGLQGLVALDIDTFELFRMPNVEGYG